MLDSRCLEEEEAEDVEVFPHIHHQHRHRLLSNFWQYRQLMQALVQNQQNQQVGGAPRDKRGEFLNGRPLVFSHATDPLEADDWLCAVEK